MLLSGNLDLDGGQLVTARQENVAVLPAFNATRDTGRLIFVTAGADLGFWFGGSGTWEKLNLGMSVVEYDVSDQTIADATTFQATVEAAGTAALRGFVARVMLTSSLSSGQVTVNLYEDSGFSLLIFSSVVDLSNPVRDNIPAYFELQDPDGDLFVEIINNAGSEGTFSLNVKVTPTVLVSVPAPPGDGSGINAGVAGDGLEYNAIDMRLEIDLATDPGLELTGSAGSRELRVLPAAGGGLENTASGLQTNSTVIRTTGAQSIGGVKTFSDSIIALTPAGSPGAPTTGTHAAGEFYLDSNLDVWQCAAGGTPGTWQFYGFRGTTAGGSLAGSSYTGTASASSSVDLEVATTGRRGIIRFLRIWGADPSFGTGDLDIPFRVAAYPNENMEGRQQLWSVSGRVVRVTVGAAGASSGTAVIPVTSVGTLEVGDLVRLRETGVPTEEYARIITITPGGPSVTVDENIANTLAQDDQVMLVSEGGGLSWKNNSAVGSESAKIFLRFFNDHPSTDVVFGYDIEFEEIGGNSF